MEILAWKSIKISLNSLSFSQVLCVFHKASSRRLFSEECKGKQFQVIQNVRVVELSNASDCIEEWLLNHCVQP